MSLFGNTGTSTGTSPFGAKPGGLFGGTATNTQQQTASNVPQDIELLQVSSDTVQALKFNPTAPNTPIFLAAGSWDNTCRIWEISENGQSEPKAMQDLGAPILSLDWTEDSSKVFITCCDKNVRLWDLQSNQVVIVGQHDDCVRSCHWVTASNYQCLMTGSWDRSLRFWDMRQLPTTNSLATIALPERVWCSDMVYPLAVVGMANRHIKSYNLEGQPQEIQDVESQLKYQNRSIAIFKNKINNQPSGFALGSIEGRVAIQCLDAKDSKDNFTFKCHRSAELINGFQEIYPVNVVAFHPIHQTLCTAGADGRYSFWDKDARTKLKGSEAMAMPITACHIHQGGNIMAYSIGYDWSKGSEYSYPTNTTKIYLHACNEEMKPRVKK
uniref:WD_REPEATS_REGION domain-containing protein n=1 Tax=Meloidogyne hapla TaxID=6305 RepID=A0A1I8BQM6_MELHA